MKKRSYTAVILAGGKGTRLYPYTIAIPKPLVPIVDKPILEMIIIQLARQGFERIIITVNHQADIIMAYFGDGHRWGVNIEYSLEDKPLGTMGPLKIIKELPQNFLIMNGDVLTDLEFGDFLEQHIEKNNLFTISGCERIQENSYGVLQVDGEKLTNFMEKPQTRFFVSMGVYAASNQIVDMIPNGEAFGFDDLMKECLNHNVRINVIEHKGYWQDIGRPDDYEKAIKDVENSRFLL